VTTAATTRNAPAVLTAALIALGVIFAGLGAIYLAKTAGQLPAFLPGHQAGYRSPSHQARPRRVRSGHLVLGRCLVHDGQANAQRGILTLRCF
jgi:hypothetical protein